MFKYNYEGFQSLLCSISKDPLEFWSKCISLDGCIKRVHDPLLNGDEVIEILGKSERSNSINYIPTSMSCPADSRDFLCSNLPILGFVIKNLRVESKLEFQLIDQHNFRRRFVLITNSSREKIPKISPSTVFLPFVLEDDWNLLELNLQTLCKEIFGTDYQLLQRITAHPNFRFRRIYLLDRHYENIESFKDINQALQDFYNVKRNIKSIDKICQTQTIFLNAIPEIISRRKRKKKINNNGNGKLLEK